MTDEKSEVARSVWFSDGTSLDTRTTDGKKVPLYATVHEETPIGWYCELLTQFPMAPEIKSCDVLRGFENLPPDTRNRVWRGLREMTIHVSDPRPYFGFADEVYQKICGVRFQTLMQRAREPGHEDFFRLGESLIGQLMLADSARHRLERVLWIAERGPWSLQGPLEDDPDDVIDELRRPRISVVASVAEYAARASAAFTPALEKATADGGEAEHLQYWGGPGPSNLSLRGTRKILEEGHAFDDGNRRLTDDLERERRGLLEQLNRNSPLRNNHAFDDVNGRMPHVREGKRPDPSGPAQHRRLVPRRREASDKAAFIDIDSRKDPRIQATDIAAGFARHILTQDGPEGLIRRWSRVYYNGIRLTQGNLDSALRFWRKIR